MKSYVTFFLANRRFLAFGLLLTFSSSFGQTFYIALFGEQIRADFSLGHGGFGTLYSLATLTSSVILVWAGRRIDDVDLRVYTALVCVGLIVACFLMAVIPGSVPLLFLTVALLRMSGQGLLGHTAATTMARYFDADRGKALSVSSLGYPAGKTASPAG